MQVALTMTPEKTSGAGFGSPGSPADGTTIQKSDIYIKYDPRTQTGYSLRYWRTTQSTTQCMFQLYRIDNGVGTPLNDTQILSGVFRPSTELVLKVIGDQITVEAHNNATSDTLALAGTITPNDFGGAGVAWYGTVPRGNSNVYSRIEISYPDLVPTESCPAQPTAGSGLTSASGGTPATDTMPALGAMSASGLMSAPGAMSPSGSSSSDGCAIGGRSASHRLPWSVPLLLGVWATRRRRIHGYGLPRSAAATMRGRCRFGTRSVRGVQQ
jgi:hypothetical protein